MPTQHFTWVTDLPVTADTVYLLMRGGRARWRIENETFNTQKNQGYQSEHNSGLGSNHLGSVLAILRTLAFLVDQIQQNSCPLFRALWAKLHNTSQRRTPAMAAATQNPKTSHPPRGGSPLGWGNIGSRTIHRDAPKR